MARDLSKIGRFSMPEFRRRIKIASEKNATTGAQLQEILNNISRITESAIKAGIIYIIIEEFQRLQQETPVDTGRARAGWLISADSSAIEFVPSTGEASYIAQSPDPSSFLLAEVIYVVNNVEYILALNSGWSKKQPAGFVDGFLLRVKSRVQAFANEINSVGTI